MAEPGLSAEEGAGGTLSMQPRRSWPLSSMHVWYRLAATVRSIRNQSHGRKLQVDDTAANTRTPPTSVVKDPARPSAAATVPTLSQRTPTPSRGLLSCRLMTPPYATPGESSMSRRARSTLALALHGCGRETKSRIPGLLASSE